MAFDFKNLADKATTAARKAQKEITADVEAAKPHVKKLGDVAVATGRTAFEGVKDVVNDIKEDRKNG